MAFRRLSSIRCFWLSENEEEDDDDGEEEDDDDDGEEEDDEDAAMDEVGSFGLVSCTHARVIASAARNDQAVTGTTYHKDMVWC